MKILKEAKLAFETPAFMAGADQNKPEVRAPSIRGALRWWFRVLGAGPVRETRVFGGVHGGAVSSKVVVRVGEEAIVHNDSEMGVVPMSDHGYLYYFAKVSGEDKGVSRTDPKHYIGRGSSFKLQMLLRGELDPGDEQLLVDAVDAFLAFGALGLRSTRGCGVFTADCMTDKELARVAGMLAGKGVFVGSISSESYDNATDCQDALGGFLRAFRGENHLSGKSESALGFSLGRRRESSALKLRPVKINGRFAPVVVYTDAASVQASILEKVKESARFPLQYQG